MDMQGYVDNIHWQVTGGVLDCELSDDTIKTIVNSSLRELQRYMSTTKYMTIPYHKCIDLSEFKVSSVYAVYRAYGNFTGNVNDESTADPMYMTQWQMLTGGPYGMYSQDFTYGYAAWNEALQIKNTTATDLDYIYDKSNNLLYINCPFDSPTKITVQYIPRYDNVEEIISDYWIDKLCRMSVAYAKVALGRIRTRFTQSNALWTQDGDKLLEEGNTELTNLRQELVDNNDLFLPKD